MAKSTEALTHFDADAIAAAQTEPTLRIRNLVYRGRLLSLPEWLPFWERLQALDAAPIAEGAAEALGHLRARLAFYESYLRAVFPKSDYRFWAPDPVKDLLSHSFEVVERTMRFFFILQQVATFGQKALDGILSTPSGTDSPDSTPPRNVVAAAE